MKTALVALSAAALVAAAAQPQNWSDFDSEWANSPEYESSKALCRSLRGREPPATDRPTAEQTAALRGCSSEDLYYGVGMPADPERARLCAFVETAEQTNDVSPYPFAGRAMLMTVYANGRGARRDLDVAIHLACGIEAAPAESHGRVTHLAELREQGWTGSDFHFCDDSTSGLAGGYCAGHRARIEQARREHELAEMTARWSPAERAALGRLREAFDAYSEAHANSGDMTGTLRAALWIGAQEELREEFLATLRQLGAGEVQMFTPTEFRAADAALNAVWRRLIRGEFADEGTGGPTRAALREAQRAWLRYRDTFIAFAAIRYPRIEGESVATLLTRQRTELLLNGE